MCGGFGNHCVRNIAGHCRETSDPESALSTIVHFYVHIPFSCALRFFSFDFMPAWPVQIFRWTVRRHTCLTSSGYTGSKSGFWVVEHLFANHMRLGLNRDSFSAWIHIFGRVRSTNLWCRTG